MTLIIVISMHKIISYLIQQNVNTRNFSWGNQFDFIDRANRSLDFNISNHSEDILDGRAFNFVAYSDSSAQSLKVRECIMESSSAILLWDSTSDKLEEDKVLLSVWNFPLTLLDPISLASILSPIIALWVSRDDKVFWMLSLHKAWGTALLQKRAYKK